VPASSFRGEALADAILAHFGDRPLKKALIPRALVAREVLPEMLRARGVEVDVVAVYRTVQASAERRGELVLALEAKSIDAAILTSSSTVENLAALLGSEAPRLLADVALASIGPITTKTAEALGLSIATTAEESTVPGTIRALEAHFARVLG
jgi:uroporphyrinogen III methyltransferase/synthase